MAKCVDKCDENMLQFEGLKCVKPDECNNHMIKSIEDLKLLNFNNETCLSKCPDGYLSKNTTFFCELESKRDENCNSIIINSTTNIKLYRGCKFVNGSVEINFQKFNKNIMDELEKALSSVEEIRDSLKIIHSPSIVSLKFLKNLKKINGNSLIKNIYSVYIWDNLNLQLLFENQQNIEILNGKVNFFANSKLCFKLINNFIKNQSLIENIDSIKNFNGNRNPSCDEKQLQFNIESNILHRTTSSSGVDYYIYYKESNKSSSTIWDSMGIKSNVESGWERRKSIETSYPFFGLKPYTQYACYIEAVIKNDETKSMRSNGFLISLTQIQYFIFTKIESNSTTNITNISGTPDIPSKTPNLTFSPFFVDSEGLNLFCDCDQCQKSSSCNNIDDENINFQNIISFNFDNSINDITFTYQGNEFSSSSSEINSDFYIILLIILYFYEFV